MVSGNALKTPRPLQRLFKLQNGDHGRNFKPGAGTLRSPDSEAMIARSRCRCQLRHIFAKQLLEVVFGVALRHSEGADCGILLCRAVLLLLLCCVLLLWRA